jgi:hypothetical protein
LQDVTAFIDFGPRIADIPDSLMARIMACQPIVSLNRQEAEIAAERFGMDPESLGGQWQKRFASALIVRHDKDGAGFLTGTIAGMFRPFLPRWWTPLAPAIVMQAVRLPGWRRDGAWLMRCSWAMRSRRGWSAIGAAIAPPRERYSSHTKTYRSLRQ